MQPVDSWKGDQLIGRRLIAGFSLASRLLLVRSTTQ